MYGEGASKSIDDLVLGCEYFMNEQNEAKLMVDLKNKIHSLLNKSDYEFLYYKKDFFMASAILLIFARVHCDYLTKENEEDIKISSKSLSTFWIIQGGEPENNHILSFTYFLITNENKERGSELGKLFSSYLPICIYLCKGSLSTFYIEIFEALSKIYISLSKPEYSGGDSDNTI